MTYDAATGNVVLFGGLHPRGRYGGRNHAVGDTWTWDGTTWTQQHPATRPYARYGASMAYDAATGNVVLFGGLNDSHVLRGTWIWNGTTWIKQHPAASPPARYFASMAYDAATGNVVLFGGDAGYSTARPLSDTWVWDGTTWTKQHPATHPQARAGASMTYDAATSNMVMFGGPLDFTGTWVWNGVTWTQYRPAASPPPRDLPSMAYDAATGNVVMFGGEGNAVPLADTWLWDGTTWTEQHPAASPPSRFGAPMAYDAATGNVVLFGGDSPTASAGDLNDTWTWGAG